MNRTFFHPLAAIGPILAAACVSGAPASAPHQPALIARAGSWTPAVKTVPTLRECRGARADNRISCYQILLASTLKTQGIDSAMAALTRLAASEHIVRDNSHMYAHSLGLAAFTTPREMATVFSRCSPGFQSGCYHGVIQGYFLDQHRRSPGTVAGAAEINALCRDFRGGEKRWLLFQCAHGLGGAFMENIVSVTNPHQMAESIAESGGMEIEGMEDFAAASRSCEAAPASFRVAPGATSGSRKIS